jgi:hypothetical protein
VWCTHERANEVKHEVIRQAKEVKHEVQEVKGEVQEAKSEITGLR